MKKILPSMQGGRLISNGTLRGSEWKFRLLLLLLCCFLGTVSFAQTAAKTYSFTFKGISFEAALKQISAQTGVAFFYGNADLKELKPLTLSVKNVGLNELLQKMFNGTGRGFEMGKSGNTIVISREQPAAAPQGKPRLLKGMVRDTDGQPIPGVIVRAMDKGAYLNVSAVIDRSGAFMIHVPETAKALHFSYIGKESVTVNIGQQTDFTVILHNTAQQIENVVVTGYQKIRPEEMTGASDTRKMEDIITPQFTTVDRMLGELIPGVMTLSNSGQVGATPKVRVRGTATILGSQEPLWVVDGIVYHDPVNISASQINDLDFVNLVGNAISGINPNDIDQITVLKDAASTALYGARAANGVIVVTTKKGLIGAPRVNYSFSGYITGRPHYSDKSVNMMNSRERIDYSREAFEKRLYFPKLQSVVGYEAAMLRYMEGEIDYNMFKSMVNTMESVNTDWFDLLMHDSFSQNHSISVSGGSQTARYYASLGYNDEQGVLKGEDKKRYTASTRVSINHKKFKGSFSMNGNISRSDHAASGVDLTDYAYNSSRTIPAFNDDGSYFMYEKRTDRTEYLTDKSSLPFNILHERDNSFHKIEINQVNVNAMVGYDFTRALDAEFTFAGGASNTWDRTHFGKNSFYARTLALNGTENKDSGGDFSLKNIQLPVGGELREDRVQAINYTLRGQLNYRSFLDKAEKHLITSSLGVEANSTRYDGFRQTLRCYMIDRGNQVSSGVDLSKYLEYAKWLSSDQEALGVRTASLTNLLSGYITVGYSYNDRYVFNVSARADGSNKFGNRSNDRLSPVWALSARWNTKKDVLRNVNWVNDLAFKFSFGYQGNMLDSQTPELIIKKGTYNYFFKELSSTIKSYPNPNLKWEKTMSMNAGTEFALLKNAIRGNFSVFYKKTSDAFLSKKVSEVNGVSQWVVNQGTIENYGFEVDLRFTPLGSMDGGKRGFRWSFDPGFGQVLNKLLNKAVETNQKVIHDEYTYADYLNGNVYISGKPLNSFYSYRFRNLDSLDGRPRFHGIDNGDPDLLIELQDKYKNASTLQEVMMAVTDYSGTRVPVIQGNINNTFSYKGVTLSIGLGYSVGSKVRLLKLYSNASGSIVAQPSQNLRAEFVNRWRVPGDELRTNIPGLISQSEYDKTLDPWWNKTGSTGTKFTKFSSNIWQMYNDSDQRVVSGDYLKLSSVALRYILPEHICEMLTIKTATVSFTGTDLYVWCSKKLNGQSPTQSGTTSIINLGVRPTYSLNFSLGF